MNIEEVRRRVEQIRQVSADYEKAHAFEDRLYKDVLKAIADGTVTEPEQLAAAALETQSILSERWYA